MILLRIHALLFVFLPFSACLFSSAALPHDIKMCSSDITFLFKVGKREKVVAATSVPGIRREKSFYKAPIETASVTLEQYDPGCKVSKHWGMLSFHLFTECSNGSLSDKWVL